MPSDCVVEGIYVKPPAPPPPPAAPPPLRPPPPPPTIRTSTLPLPVIVKFPGEVKVWYFYPFPGANPSTLPPETLKEPLPPPINLLPIPPPIPSIPRIGDSFLCFSLNISTSYQAKLDVFAKTSKVSSAVLII